jgi:hypothetical protein
VQRTSLVIRELVIHFAQKLGVRKFRLVRHLELEHFVGSEGRLDRTGCGRVDHLLLDRSTVGTKLDEDQFVDFSLAGALSLDGELEVEHGISAVYKVVSSRFQRARKLFVRSLRVVLITVILGAHVRVQHTLVNAHLVFLNFVDDIAKLFLSLSHPVESGLTFWVHEHTAG